MGKKSANAEKKLPPLKPILALPTWGQMWILSELWVLEKGNFDLGHPVYLQQQHFQRLRFSWVIGDLFVILSMS